MDEILDAMKLHIEDQFTTIHNYSRATAGPGVFAPGFFDLYRK